jgi:hypothetical protein
LRHPNRDLLLSPSQLFIDLGFFAVRASVTRAAQHATVRICGVRRVAEMNYSATTDTLIVAVTSA